MSDPKTVSTKLFRVLTDKLIEAKMRFWTHFYAKSIQNSILELARYLTEIYH